MPSLLKNILFYLLVTVIISESLPYLLSRQFLHQPFSRRALIAALTNNLYEGETPDSLVSSREDQEEYLGDHIVHPYLGFVSAPGPGNNELGFQGASPLMKKSGKKINVCLMGGSVSMNLHAHSAKRLLMKLEKIKSFRDKELQITVIALGGFKQPQQLLALNYFMALGAHYDLVINLDGFNEIVLPYSDNLPFGIFPSYPRHWHIYSRKRIDPAVNKLLAKKIFLKSEKEELKNIFSSSLFRHSNFALFAWKIMDNKKSYQLYETENHLREVMQTAETSYQSTGPAIIVNDTIKFFNDQAEFWMQSSLQIGKISKAAGFDYFHFLQPNQYIPNSKIFTEEELENAFEKGPFAYKDAVQTGYPMLQEKGKDLLSNNISFVDLTGMFKQEFKTVYSDKCCHFNQYGYDLIADTMAGYIADYYD